MKYVLLFGYALLPMVSFSQKIGTSPDTLWTIHIQFASKSGKPTARVQHYKYRESIYRGLRQRNEFVNQLLSPLVAARGDSLVQTSLMQYVRAKRQKAVLGYSCLGLTTTGAVFQLLGAANVLESHLPNRAPQREPGERQIWIGTALVGLGGATGLMYFLTATRPRRLLHRTINAYNQRLQRPVSWQVVPTGTGLRLVGQF
jgi:hypothetical protein